MKRKKSLFRAFRLFSSCTATPAGVFFELMLTTSNGRFLNPHRALQIYESIEAPHTIYYNYDEWELPPGAHAHLVSGEPTISYPFEQSGQLNRLYARFVWSKEISGHVNPGAPETGAGRLYQFVGKVSFNSAEYEGFKASNFVRVTAWSSGARRRGNTESKLFICSGDPFCLINLHSKASGQISARSWWPASELEWKTAKKYSFWDSSTVGLTTDCWSSFPKAGVEALIPSQLELNNTEVIINFPSFISHPGEIKRHLVTGGPPPPPPCYPESSWEHDRSASYRTSSQPPAPTGPLPPHPAQYGTPMDLLAGYGSSSQNEF